jgi:uncharacterized protein YegL
MSTTTYVPAELELPPDQPGPFAPAAILADTSSSMHNEIGQLNAGLADLADHVRNDTLARNRADLTVIEFDSSARVAVPPTLGLNFQAPQFNASGSTSMGQAIHLGLKTLRERRAEYRSNGVQGYTALMFLITDGQPTDEWQSAAAEVHRWAASGKLEFFAIGTASADMATLAQISPPTRPPMLLKAGCWAELFSWISDSLSDISGSQPGDAMGLRPADGWGQIAL